MITTANRFIATEPFPASHITGTTKGGLAFIDQKIQLTKLKVTYKSFFKQNDRELFLLPGDYIYVAGDQYVQGWAKKVYELDEGKPFILTPYESVVFVETSGDV
jgi:hypothetical protein